MNKFFLYLRTEEFRKNLIIAITSILAFLLIIFFTLRFYTRHGESLPVPKLKGLTIENAIALLESQGLTYSIDSVYQIDQPPGTVIEQDPDPNTNVKTNRTIYLTIITRQAPNVNFPDIRDKPFIEVQAILNNLGLKVGDTIYKPDVARDRVLEAQFAGQPVRKGEIVPKGSRVNLVLGDGRGNSEIDLPDLIGYTLGVARFKLSDGALSLGEIKYEGVIRDTARAIIIKQLPALSDTLSKVPIGSRIDVILSEGK